MGRGLHLEDRPHLLGPGRKDLAYHRGKKGAKVKPSDFVEGLAKSERYQSPRRRQVIGLIAAELREWEARQAKAPTKVGTLEVEIVPKKTELPD